MHMRTFINTSLIHMRTCEYYTLHVHVQHISSTLSFLPPSLHPIPLSYSSCMYTYLSICLPCFSSLACAFICWTSMVSGFRRRMYSSWLPMHRARIRLLTRSRGALNTKSWRENYETTQLYGENMNSSFTTTMCVR